MMYDNRLIAALTQVSAPENVLSFAHAIGTALPPALKNALEYLSGYDLSAVRVFYASPLPMLFGARAFAYGTDIYLGPGAEDALPHEAWHVVQQLQGRVAPIGELHGLGVNQGYLLEREADEMAELVMGMGDLSVEVTDLRKGELAYAPVMQFVCNIAGNAYTTATQVRDYYWNTHRLGPGNTNHLAQASQYLIDISKTLTTDAAALRFFKKIDRGIQIADNAMRMFQENDAAFHRYNADSASVRSLANSEISQRSVRQRDAMRGLSGVDRKRVASELSFSVSFNGRTESFRYSAKNMSSRSVIKKMVPREFLQWQRKTIYGNMGDNVTPFYSLLTDPEVLTCRTMNCWEFVLLVGLEAGILDYDYLRWAIIEDTIAIDAISGMTKPRYTNQIYRGPGGNFRYHQAQKPAGRNYCPLPGVIHPGSVVIFGDSAHVAVATGRQVPQTDHDAQTHYGPQGWEIVELDAGTRAHPRTVESPTIEQILVENGPYNGEITLGWFPTIPAGRYSPTSLINLDFPNDVDPYT
ncbi:MAG: DUF4157 domain-containing protein [Bacteroidota bacterium]